MSGVAVQLQVEGPFARSPLNSLVVKETSRKMRQDHTTDSDMDETN